MTRRRRKKASKKPDMILGKMKDLPSVMSVSPDESLRQQHHSDESHAVLHYGIEDGIDYDSDKSMPRPRMPWDFGDLMSETDETDDEMSDGIVCSAHTSTDNMIVAIERISGEDSCITHHQDTSEHGDGDHETVNMLDVSSAFPKAFERENGDNGEEMAKDMRAATEIDPNSVSYDDEYDGRKQASSSYSCEDEDETMSIPPPDYIQSRAYMAVMRFRLLLEGKEIPTHLMLDPWWEDDTMFEENDEMVAQDGGFVKEPYPLMKNFQGDESAAISSPSSGPNALLLIDHADDGEPVSSKMMTAGHNGFLMACDYTNDGDGHGDGLEHSTTSSSSRSGSVRNESHWNHNGRSAVAMDTFANKTTPMISEMMICDLVHDNHCEHAVENIRTTSTTGRDDESIVRQQSFSTSGYSNGRKYDRSYRNSMEMVSGNLICTNDTVVVIDIDDDDENANHHHGVDIFRDECRDESGPHDSTMMLKLCKKIGSMVRLVHQTFKNAVNRCTKWLVKSFHRI